MNVPIIINREIEVPTCPTCNRPLEKAEEPSRPMTREESIGMAIGIAVLFLVVLSVIGMFSGYDKPCDTTFRSYASRFNPPYRLGYAIMCDRSDRYEYYRR